MLSAGAVPAARGNFRHDLLAGADLRPENVEAMRQFLEQKWNVKRRIDLLNTLEKLQKHGRRLAIAKQLGELRKLKLTEKEIDSYWKGEERDTMRTLFRNAARLEKE